MSWVRKQPSSFLISSAVFVVFVLDMASPGYGSFALIPNMQPLIAPLTTDIRSVRENLTRSKSSLPLPSEIQANSELLNCRMLLDAYKKNAKCHFNPKNYSNISR